MSEPQWKIDERTIRDCPDDRTKEEWTDAVNALEERLLSEEKKGVLHCEHCKQSVDPRYRVTETESWLPSSSDPPLPRGRWALSARAATLDAARQLQAFMGPRAVVYVAVSFDDEGRPSTFKVVK